MLCNSLNLRNHNNSTNRTGSDNNKIFDIIRFNQGCLRVIANRYIGANFTIDFQLHVQDTQRHQLLFM